MAKKFIKKKPKEKLRVSSLAKPILPKIPIPKTTEETTEESPEEQATEEALIEQAKEIEGLNNNGYFRFYQLSQLAAINKNLAELNENMNGIGEVLEGLKEAIEKSMEDQE